jgi:hypothetical protein
VAVRAACSIWNLRGPLQGKILLLLLLLQQSLGENSPEEAFAAFTGHSIEVEACGSVSAHPTYPGYIPVKVTRVRQGSAGCYCLHTYKNNR